MLGAKTSGNQVGALQNKQIGDCQNRKVGEQRVTKPRSQTRGAEQSPGHAAGALHRGGTDEPRVPKIRVAPEGACRIDEAAPLQLQHADIAQQGCVHAGQLVECLHAWFGFGSGFGFGFGFGFGLGWG